MSVAALTQLPEVAVASQEGSQAVNKTDQAVINRYLGLITREARLAHAKIRRKVDFSELLSLGADGLLDAHKKFDETKGRFTTYATHRIRGAILDGLRSADPAPRLTRDRSKVKCEVIEALKQRFCRPPCDEEVQDELRRQGYDWPLHKSNLPLFLNIPRTQKNQLLQIRDRGVPRPDRAVANRDQMRFLMAPLSSEQREIVYLHFWEDMNSNEIARVVGRSQPFVSFHLKLAIGLMRVQAEGKEEELVA